MEVHHRVQQGREDPSEKEEVELTQKASEVGWHD
jgi:hypothetical protein